MPRLQKPATALCLILALHRCQPSCAQQPPPPDPQFELDAARSKDPLADGKAALAQRDFQRAEAYFAVYRRDHPSSTQTDFYSGEAALGLRQYDTAAEAFQRVIAKQPSLWAAHKNLVIAYAAQGKWPEFDEQRKILDEARNRGALGVSPQDADIIDVLYIDSEPYIVRAFATPEGRTRAHYNVSHFIKDTQLDYWISCESPSGKSTFLLNAYTPNPKGKPRSTLIKSYPEGEPTYETVRTDVLNILEQKTKAPKAKPSAPK
jgi:tetratricopeptide (TPR) repeat protein